MKITLLVGARPNFMKAAPIVRQLAGHAGVEAELVHTGQHYDEAMSKVFFRELGLPEPDSYLGVGSGSHAEQTAAVMTRLEPYLRERRPDWLLVVGDVNSTMAGALTAAKLWIRVAHVEAGLRSFDRAMPEEVNRIVTDSISELLFTTEESANVNLRAEGHAEGQIAFVGNVMIDTLGACLGKAARIDVRSRLGLGEARYALMTLHRPSNVDDRGALERIVSAAGKIAADIPVVFPAHPRTTKRLAEFGLEARGAGAGPSAGSSLGAGGLRLVEPMGYLEFLSLMRGAAMVLTDSGGMQEETTVLGVPCLTMRENTERPVTVEIGTSELVGNDPEKILDAAARVLSGTWKRGRTPPLWDGRAAERIVERLLAGGTPTQP